MACRNITVRDEDGKPFSAVVCGGPKPKRCAFCDNRSEIPCDWPVDQLKLVDVVTLKSGDVIAHPKRTVVSARLVMGGSVFVTCNPGPSFQAPIGARISAIVRGTCDKSACVAHHRSVGENVDYCQDHWKAMEQPL